VGWGEGGVGYKQENRGRCVEVAVSDVAVNRNSPAL